MKNILLICLLSLLTLACNKGIFDSADDAVVTASSITATEGEYVPGTSSNNLDIVVTFSESVYVSGVPRVQLTIGSDTRYANYLSGSGTTSLTFRYVVQVGDIDLNGIDSVSPILLNSGSIKNTANINSSLTFTGANWDSVLVTAGPLAPAPSGVFLPSGGDSLCGAGSNVDAIPGTHNSVVSIERLYNSGWSHSCMGVLLSSNKVLTAAHCVDGASTSVIRVVAGLYDRSDYTNSQIAYVSSYISASDELSVPNPGDFSSDLAVITLADAIVPAANVTQVTLPIDNSNAYVGEIVSSYGWWQTSNNNSGLPNLLQCGGSYILSNATTDGMLSGIVLPMDEGQFGFWDNNNWYHGSGAGGAPLFISDGGGGTILAGVMSFSLNDAQGMNYMAPTVSVRLSYYLAWINAKVAE